MKSALLFALLLASTTVFAIQGGKPINPQEFPALVSLYLNDRDLPEYDFFCSGVLVASDKVLTAGHCVTGIAGEAYDDVHRLIYFSEVVTVKIGGRKVRARNITLAPSYFEHWGLESEDLALIELESPIKDIKPLPLLSVWELKQGMELTMVARGKSATTKLQKVLYYAEGTVLLTDTSKSAICQGDSGGALLAQKNGQLKLAGILISEGEEECNLERNYSFFPRVKF